MLLNAVQRVILGDGVSLMPGDVGLEQVAPADEADEDVEKYRLDSADEDLQVPVPLLVEEAPVGRDVPGAARDPRLDVVPTRVVDSARASLTVWG